MAVNGYHGEEVRKAKIEDIPALVELARECYPGYSLVAAPSWAEQVINLDNAAIFISGESVAIVCWQIEMWRPNDRIADVLPTYSKAQSGSWSEIRVLKECIKWAKEQDCYAIRFGSTTDPKGPSGGIDLFEPFAKRLSAREHGRTYIVEF